MLGKKFLPRYEDDLTSWIDMRQMDMKRVAVHVEDIIGGSKTSANEHDVGWTPACGAFDQRYERAFNFVKKYMEERGHVLPDEYHVGTFQSFQDESGGFKCTLLIP
ncbi:MAG: hypothetical protein JW839_22305 [Candidatus Lokiarchaeota archaeon]|nr:hypothetical protein [Candidatus Lokiarchaeota archaeon]